jgi:UDP-glucose 4-epimerase
MSYHILVTGGAGYIGSHTVLRLLDQGFQVTIIDKNETNKVFASYINKIPEKCTFIKLDLLDISSLHKVFENNNFDGVIHFAADPSFVSQEAEYVSRYYTNNVISSINLIESCRVFGIKKFVFSSTAAMYGNPEKLPIVEDSNLKPINVYGYTKSVVEKMLIDYSTVYNFGSIRLRYFNACGADLELRSGEEHHPEVHLIPNILKSVGTSKTFELYGSDYKTKDGTCMRDYIHVCDLANAHILALDLLLNSKELVCDVVNLGTGNGYTNKEVFDTAEKIVNQKISLKFAPRRFGDADELVADNNKAKRVLNWTPIYSDLHNIIQSAWDWENKTKNIIKDSTKN